MPKPFPLNPNYIIYENGTILSKLFKIPKKLKLNENSFGYKKCHLSVGSRTKYFYLHRVMLLTFVGPCPVGKMGGHLDGNSRNNHISNLAWITRAENEAHKARDGRCKGSKNGFSKLTELQVIEIKKMRAAGITQKSCALKFGVSRSTIKNIDRRANWSWLSIDSNT